MEKKKRGHTLYLSVTLALIALVSAVAATMAWFSIADYARLQSMRLDITSGYALRIDMVPHETYEEYRETISLAEIVNTLVGQVSEEEYMTALQPVTTRDGVHFTDEFGNTVSAQSGQYLEFVVHFMANKDMLVHLSGEGDTGSRITSSNPQVPQAMRISFMADGVNYIYSPGLGDVSRAEELGKVFGLPDSAHMVMNKNNALWDMKAGVDVPVTIRIWLEGTDSACNNDIQGADYQIQLKFEGSDENHQRFNDNE